MSLRTTRTYRIICDHPDCTHTTHPAVSPETADETALEAGWYLTEDPDNPHDPGPDYCPEHAP